MNNLDKIAQAKYYETYRSWRKWDEHTLNNCLKDEPCYTFAEDMAMYVGRENYGKEVDAYINRMLEAHCVNGNAQAYYEMVLGLMSLSWTLYYAGLTKECDVIIDRYNQYFFDKKTYSKWVSDEDHMKLMKLR